MNKSNYLLLIDNYDSFTYNLYQAFAKLCKHIDLTVKVARNNELNWNETLDQVPAALVISPGPGRPEDSGCCLELISKFHKDIPILGVCLGHQAIGQFFGARVVKAPYPVHGKAESLELIGDSRLFSDNSCLNSIMRYHSLILDPDSIPSCLKVTARANDGSIMAVEHVSLPVFGVQFHPESFLSSNGEKILENFLSYANSTSNLQKTNKQFRAA